MEAAPVNTAYIFTLFALFTLFTLYAYIYCRTLPEAADERLSKKLDGWVMGDGVDTP